MLTTDSDLPFIHNDELAVQTHVGEPGNRESKSSGYGVLRGRVQAQAEAAGGNRSTLAKSPSSVTRILPPSIATRRTAESSAPASPNSATDVASCPNARTVSA
jgi:hypothetical protein